jgi:hypothetical protein
MVNNHQNTWSNIIKQLDHKSSKDMVNNHQTALSKPSKSMVKHRPKTWSDKSSKIRTGTGATLTATSKGNMETSDHHNLKQHDGASKL